MPQVDQLQKRVGLSHSTSLSEREHTLQSRDEYLKSMQERLHRQETENSDERARLQSLVSKLEMQLREQGKQFEQDRWKKAQDENRIISMQVFIQA